MSDYLKEELEKRRFARVSNKFLLRSCKIDVSREAEVTKVAGIVHDINEAGVSFLTQEKYARADVLELEIELTGVRHPLSESTGLLNSATIVLSGTVVRQEVLDEGLYLVAAAFMPLEKNDRALLLQGISLLQD